ncbi:hypothetical protein B0H21DRAFT_579924 [Amylocystis lapponica]|nr:hypothetical protein B0H21DRAFT_579924 [Amylocystis lapponica]
MLIPTGGGVEQAHVGAVSFSRLRTSNRGRNTDVYTTIYDKSLYKHLTTLAHACSATEIILFKRTTFLVIAKSAPPPAPSPHLAPPALATPPSSQSMTPRTVSMNAGPEADVHQRRATSVRRS